MLVLVIGDLHIPDRAIEIPAKFRKLLVPGKIEKVLCLGNITDRETLHYLQGLSREFLAVKGEFDDPVIYQHVKTEESNGYPRGQPQLQQQAPQDIGVGSLSGSTSIGGGFAAVSGANSNGGPGGATPAAYMSNAPDGATLNTYANVSGGGSEGLPVKAVRKPVRPATAVESISLPLSRVVTLGELRIGFNSGHTIVPNSDPDALLIAARQLDVDIFIWGGTHRVEAYKLEGKFFVNPGSATGAFYTGWPDPEDDDDDEEEEGDEEEEKGDGEKPKDGEEEGKSDGAEGDDKPKDGEEKEKADVEIVDIKDPIPSFCLLDIQGTVCVVYIYRYIDGEVKVDKINYRRDE